MKARGNTKIVLEKVGRIQELIGKAQGGFLNDISVTNRGDVIQDSLNEAFELCIEITGMYDPI